ncbi:hypothetical protein GI374_09080 [Paracoccus sp. S-4012]|uniref:hypothetical protein n=1 Tax=Paracoccus sp. S-4012 TaxID=2665648 RepID=UPI0012B15D9A|nr:hypothetical protein [Paracoccus sp. S-4012]MRX50595.1 hypothetical protein [Paracoccus sp. S-4012]
MKWIGVTLLALAAVAMLAGDLMAAPHHSWTLRFDLFTPKGVNCEASAPHASVRRGQDLRGMPRITVTGDISTASITCTAPDGSRWRTALPADSRRPLSQTVEGLATWRPNARWMRLQVLADPSDIGQSTAPQVYRFTRLP